MTTKQKPALIAYTVTGDDEKTFWTRIGTAWPHKNGEGFNIELAALPLGGRIVMITPKAEQGADGEIAS